MDMMMAGIGMLGNLLFLALVVAGVMKLFQIHSTLTEIQERLAKVPASQPATTQWPPVPTQQYAAPPAPSPHYATAPQQSYAPAPQPAYAPPMVAAAPQGPVAQPSLLRMPAAPAGQTMTQPLAQPVAPMASLVGDTRSGEEMLRELDQQMRLENVSNPGSFDPR